MTGSWDLDIKVGDRVRRGPDWCWYDQGKGTKGTCTEVRDFNDAMPLRFRVRWDNGYTESYGDKDGFDIIKDVWEQEDL